MIHFRFTYCYGSMDDQPNILHKDIFAKSIEEAKAEFNRQICSDNNVRIIEISPVESL